MPGQTARDNGKKGGRPSGTKGIKWKSTIDKALQLEIVRQLVSSELEPMVRKQIAHAQGIDHFFMRDPKTKRFEQVTNPAAIAAALNSGDRDSYYWVFTKDPSVQAFSDLMDRAFDKPAQPQKVTGEDGGPVQIAVSMADVPWRKSSK